MSKSDNRFSKMGRFILLGVKLTLINILTVAIGMHIASKLGVIIKVT